MPTRKFKEIFIAILIIYLCVLCWYFMIYCNRFENNLIYTHPVQQLQSTDYKKLFNLTDFRFGILNECTFSPLLLVCIHTSPTHFDRRKNIRETWGGSRQGLKVVFMLGNVQDLLLQKKLEKENEEYNDLIQGSFLDAYTNITYKHIMLFKYAIYHCPRTKYILKTDDDVFVNMPALTNFINEKLSPYGTKSLLLCSVRRLAVERNHKSKWYVSVDEYKSNMYPPFCAGSAILYSPDVLFELYQEAQLRFYFRLDDVYVTGILVKNRKVLHTDVTPYILTNDNMKKVLKNDYFYNCSKGFLYGPRNLPIKKIDLLWDVVKNKNC